MSLGRPPVYKEINASEIQSLLNEGLTRKEVCQRLEICYHTLQKIIGKDPNRKPYERRSKTEPKKVYIENDKAKLTEFLPSITPQNRPSKLVVTQSGELHHDSASKARATKIGGNLTTSELKRRSCEELSGEFMRYMVYSNHEIRVITNKALFLDLDGLKRMAQELMRAYTEIERMEGRQ